MLPSIARVVRGLGRLRFGRGPGTLPHARQFVEMLAGAGRGGFSPLEYQLYGFYRRDRDRSGYVPLRWIEREFRARLNPPASARVLKDKLAFFAFCRERGLPTARVLGLVGSVGAVPDGVAVVSNAVELEGLLAGLPPGRLVAKPVGALGGKGVMLFEKREDGMLVNLTARREVTPAALWLAIADDIDRRQGREDSRTGYLLQEYVRPVAAMNPSGGTALNTVRLATLGDARGAVRLDFAMLRLARPGAPSDNLHQGGTVAGIDLESGVIRAPAWGYETPAGPWLATRPDAGEQFPGRRVPAWEALTALALACATALPEARSVGWDIALGESGPVVIEGNDNWDMVIAQVLDGPYLTTVRRAILTGLGLRLPRAGV